MMKKTAVVFLCAILVISLGGCATGRRQKDLEIQGLKNQLAVLESQLQSRDQEIFDLKSTLDSSAQEKSASAKKKIIPEVKSRPSVKQIQAALKNAGYDPGSLDGKTGRQTRNAIKAFQKDKNLLADGKVGKETWDLLKEYLYKKIK